MKSAAVIVLAFLLAAASRAATVPAPDYDRDVRPIISENCIACHGPDKHKGNLRLDQRETPIKAAKSGEIPIVPKQPEKSELIRRITTSDSDDHMPPVDSHKKLTAAQIDTLTRWVAAGAPYKTHWAFIPPVRPELPKVHNEAWVRNPIDRFILAKLESEKLNPSPEADKVTLLRRLSLDLTGLPPTIKEVNAFLADKSPDAYEKQVDRLLASPHYGEKWARHWLDAARYADSDGFEKDKMRFVWFYRDYVIKAFNQDKPYNQFIIEQLAGDQLPNPTQDQLVATGFLRNSMVNEEGGVVPEQFRMDEMFDRMDCIGKSVLGLTIQCGQCHNHKYDPLTQEDYYKLFAFLNNDHEASRVAYTPPQQMKIADILRQKREIEGGLRHEVPDWESQMAAWEQKIKNDQPKWQVLKLTPGGDFDQRYTELPDGSYLAAGYAPTKFTQIFTTETSLKKVTAFRVELMTDPNLPARGPGRAADGGCALSEFKVDINPEPGDKKPPQVKFTAATDDYDQPTRPLADKFYDKTPTKRTTGNAAMAIDGDQNTAWCIDAGPGLRNQDRKAVFTCQPVAATQPSGGIKFTIHLVQNHGGWNSDDLQTNNLGRFRISATSDDSKATADPLPKRVRDILAIPREKRTDRQVAEVFNYWRTTVPEWKAENDQIAELYKGWPEGTTAFVLEQRKYARQTHVLTRGDWLKPTTVVSAGVPKFLNQLQPNAPPTRLTFAKWLVDPKSPTTARVFVNRIWQNIFGIGIVATSEDFGLQGEQPSHPQLLDWLAVEFMEPTNSDAKPWSIKHIQKLIVMSSAYRQQSKVTPEMLERDPNNRLLARGPRFRVDGEIVRDIALKASGLLNEEIGGRSVMPPAPAFLFKQPTSFAEFPWVDEKDNEKYRRAIYTFRRRSTPYPVLQTFDVPNGDSSCVRRSRSNSPLQALASLNESIFFECAQALAKQTLEHGGASDDSRIEYAFRRALSREPKPAEVQELESLLDREVQRIEAGGLNANELATGKSDAIKVPEGSTVQQWAAYTVVSRVLLNLDETITKE